VYRPLHNRLSNSVFFFFVCVLLCVWSSCMAWHGQASGTRISVKSGFLPFVPVLEPEGWTLGNPAYSLRSSCSGVCCCYRFCVTWCRLACFLSLLPSSLSFSLPPHTCTWVFHVHGCVGMCCMWLLRHSCAWYWCEVQLGVCRGCCLFWPFAAL